VGERMTEEEGEEVEGEGGDVDGMFLPRLLFFFLSTAGEGREGRERKEKG